MTGGPAASRSTLLEWLGLAAAVLLAAGLAWPLRAYVTDDTYIHLQYARHVAHGDGFVFNTGERVYGTTSPLWVLLIADAMAIGVDGLLAARLLGAACTLASIVLWFALVRRTLERPWLRVAATLVWAAHAWMLRWSLSGMETPLATSLVLGGALAFAWSRPWGAGRAGLASLLWALAALARPECALLLPLWALLLAFDLGLGAGLHEAARGLWPGGLVLAGWLGWARVWFGRFWPNTLAAKAAGGTGLDYHLEQLARQVGIVLATDAVLGLALVLALAARVARREGVSLRPSVRLLPWVWAAAIPLLYIVRGVPVLSRYLVPLLPLGAWLAWRELDRWQGGVARSKSPASDATRRGSARSAVAAAVAVFAIVENLVVWTRVVKPQVDSFSAGMQASLVPWGRWFAAHAPADAVIAAPDIGALGYLSQRRVLDLAGLVSPEMVPILRRMSQEDATARFEFTRFARPDYVVDRAPRAWDLERRSAWAASLARIGHASLPNLGIARPVPTVYSFYRIEWAAYDSLAGTR